jgi:cell division protein FtsN
MLPPGNLVIRQEEVLAQAAFDFATDAETYTKIANEEISKRFQVVTEEQRQFLDQKLSDHTLSGLEREEIIEEHDRELIALQAQVCVSVIHTHTHTQTNPPHTHTHTPHTHTQAHTLTHTHTKTNSHTCFKHSSR